MWGLHVGFNNMTRQKSCKQLESRQRCCALEEGRAWARIANSWANTYDKGRTSSYEPKLRYAQPIQIHANKFNLHKYNNTSP